MESMQASVGGWRVMLCAVELSPHLLHHYHYQRFIIRNRIFIMLNFAQICKALWAHSAMNMPPSIDYQSISISYFLSSPLWSHAQFRYKGFVSESTYIWVKKGILTQRIMEQEKKHKVEVDWRLDVWGRGCLWSQSSLSLLCAFEHKCSHWQLANLAGENIPYTLKKGHNTKQKDVLFSLGLKAVSHTGYWEQGRLWYSRFWSMKNKLDTHIRLERLAMALTHRYAIFLCR